MLRPNPNRVSWVGQDQTGDGTCLGLRLLELEQDADGQHHHGREGLEHLDERHGQIQVGRVPERQGQGLAGADGDHVLGYTNRVKSGSEQRANGSTSFKPKPADLHVETPVLHLVLVLEPPPEDADEQVGGDAGGDEPQTGQEHGVVEAAPVVEVLEDVLVEQDQGRACVAGMWIHTVRVYFYKRVRQSACQRQRRRQHAPMAM